MQKPIKNQVFVKVQDRYVDGFWTKDESGNSKKIFYGNTPANEGQRSQIKATVVATPLKVDYEIGNPYEGFPKPVRGRSSEFIRNQLKKLPYAHRKEFSDKWQSHTLHDWDDHVIHYTRQELMPDDEVWFHYNSLRDDAWITYLPDEEMHIYSIDYFSVFCFKRKNRIKSKNQYDLPEIKEHFECINGYCLIDDYYGEEFEQIEVAGHTIMARFSNNRELIVETTNKPKFRQGVVNTMPKLLFGDEWPVKPGDRVIFTPNSEFYNTIDGQKYMVMQYWDLMAKFVDNELIPLSDYLIFKPYEYNYTGNMVIKDPENLRQKPDKLEGKVLRAGNQVKELSRGNHIWVEKGSYFFYWLDKETAICREEDVYMKKPIAS